jgi:hypothetical protein
VLAWRAALALRAAPLPGRLPVVGVLGVSAALTWWSEGTLLGREPGITLLVVLMALKTLELRARRDAMVTLFLGFFLVLTQFLYSQSIGIAVSALLATWGLMTALALSHMPGPGPALRRAAGVAARAAVLGVPAMVVLFVFFPRVGRCGGCRRMPQAARGCRARCGWESWPRSHRTTPSRCACGSMARPRHRRRCTSAARCCLSSMAGSGHAPRAPGAARHRDVSRCRPRGSRWTTRSPWSPARSRCCPRWSSR